MRDEDAISILAAELLGDDAQVRANNMVKTIARSTVVPIATNGRDGKMVWLSRAFAGKSGSRCWVITDTDPRVS